MDDSKLRYWWWCKQGLDGSLQGCGAREVLARSGWARSIGGGSPYLTLFARAGISRQAADEAAAGLDIYELPAARGCTYVVPAEDFGLALAAGVSEAEMKTARKLGVTDQEIGQLEEAIVRALEGGPLDPEGIKSHAGPAVRNLGAEGVKKGLSTTLPLALGRLQSSGAIRRIPVNGRFDSQRYRYASWGFAVPRLSPEEIAVELAGRFFRWIGPASLADFQTFSGLSLKAAKAATADLGLSILGDRLLTREDLAIVEDLREPGDPQYVLLSNLDAYLLLRGEGKVALGEHHAIVDRGQVAGVWEYDPAAGSIVWKMLVGQRNDGVAEAVRRTEEFIRGQLGDVRSFSLDSPKSRAPRLQALRASM